MTTTPTPAAAADLPEALDQLFENLHERIHEWSNYVRADDAPTTLPKYVAGAIKELRSAVESLHALTASAPAEDEDGVAFRAAVVAGEDRAIAMREAVKRAADIIEAGGEAQCLEQAQQAAPQAGAESDPPSDSKQVFVATMRSIYGNEFPDQGAFAGEHGWGNEWAIFQAGAALRAGHAAPPAQQPGAAGESLILSNGVREYLREGIDNATGGEEADIDRDFADELQTLLHNTLYLSAPAAPSAQADAPVPSDADIEALRDAFDWEGWTCPKAAQRAFARAVLARWSTAPSAPTQEAAQPAAALPGEQHARDVAFEAVRRRLCKVPRYSFALDSRGNIRRCEDKSGNWIEFDAAHKLFDPVAVDAAMAAKGQEGGTHG